MSGTEADHFRCGDVQKLGALILQLAENHRSRPHRGWRHGLSAPQLGGQLAELLAGQLIEHGGGHIGDVEEVWVVPFEHLLGSQQQGPETGSLALAVPVALQQISDGRQHLAAPLGVQLWLQQALHRRHQLKLQPLRGCSHPLLAGQAAHQAAHQHLGEWLGRKSLGRHHRQQQPEYRQGQKQGSRHREHQLPGFRAGPLCELLPQALSLLLIDLSRGGGGLLVPAQQLELGPRQHPASATSVRLTHHQGRPGTQFAPVQADHRQAGAARWWQ